MRPLKDDQGRRWIAERVGRTSGIVPQKGSGSQAPEPADIIRFGCKSNPDEADRETTLRAGLLEELSDSELLAILQTARRLTPPKSRGT